MNESNHTTAVKTRVQATIGGQPMHLDRTEAVFDEELTREQWVHAGQALLTSAEASPWWVGDWLLYAERRWATADDGSVVTSQRAAIRDTVARMTSLDIDTLKHHRMVAKLIPVQRRRPNVSWTHHRKVAHLEVDVADRLLERAEVEQWNAREMVEAVRSVRALDVDEVGPDEERLKPLRATILLTGTEADHDTIDELVRATAADLEKRLARKKVTATVEVT